MTIRRLSLVGASGGTASNGAIELSWPTPRYASGRVLKASTFGLILPKLR